MTALPTMRQKKKQIHGTKYLEQNNLISLKATEGLSTYKHKIKKHFPDRMKNNIYTGV